MLRNFLTVAFRNLRRQFMYSMLNIVGLAVGMACSLVMLLYVYGEWSHDKHFQNADRIYRISVSFFNLGQFAKSPEMLAEQLPDEFAGIEHITTFNKNPAEQFTIGDKTYQELVYEVDSSFFEVFSYEFAAGSPSAVVDNPNSIVLTESIAEKFFGEGSALGKTIDIGKDKVPFLVTGIVNDDNRNAHLKAKIWIRPTSEPNKTPYWSSAAVYTYVLLKENVTMASLREGLDALIENRVFPTFGKMMGKKSMEEYMADQNSVQFYIYPLKDIYLKSSLALELSPGGNEKNMIIFLVIAGFILVLAAVNFINLSTARATRRAKEVGVRKSLGTSRSKLVGQFLLESVVVSMISMALALCLAELFSLAFLWITGQPLSVSVWSGVSTLIIVVGFGVLVGTAAGLYPAFYLTKFQPSRVLKGNVQHAGNQRFRDVLVIFQFSISITLIIGTLIIIRQLNYMSEKDLGFNQENTITIDGMQMLGQSAVAFRNELQQREDVVKASLHTGEPGYSSLMSMMILQTPRMENGLSVNTYFGDADFLETMGIKLLQGRNFDSQLASDTASIILNESAVQALGLPDNPVGSVINNDNRVIGVVSDFHWETMRNAIAPVAIMLKNERKPDLKYFQLALRIKSGSAASIIKQAESMWKARVTDEPFKYHFLDENFGALFRKEEIFGKAIGFFTVLAIAISCLGLFGLAAYTTDQRTKEIGIRKVLGASVGNVVMMLSRKFVTLVAISIVIAVPVAYFAANEWLASFAYKSTLSVITFSLGSVLGLTVCCLTVAYHSLKASRTNPAETLKCE